MTKQNSDEKTKPIALATTPMNSDGWANLLSGLGTQARDKRRSTAFTRSSPLDQEEIDNIFHGDDTTATICELPAREMTREWFTLMVPIVDDVDLASEVMTKLADLDLQRKTKEAITWSRAYGGSLIFIAVDDGEEDQSQPLNVDNLKSIKSLTVMDRHEVHVSEYYSVPGEEKFGQPKIYMITQAIADSGVVVSVNANQRGATGERIHETRVVRFDGVTTSRRRKRQNNGWSESILDRVYDVIRDFNDAYGAAAHLMTDFAQAIFRIKGLADMLADDKQGMVLQRLRLMDLSRSVSRAIPLDTDEDFERKATPLSGMPQILDRLAMRLSAASRIPVTLLMGRSPAGMNATGESDIRLFYDTIKADQEDKLRGPLEYLVWLCFRSKDGPTSGKEPASWSIAFDALWQESSKEKAETRKTVAETDQIYVNMGAITEDEVRTSRWAGDEYSPDMQLVDTGGEREAENVASVNELSLTIERAARVGDIVMINAARLALANRLGVEPPREVTIEELGATLKVLKQKELEANPNLDARNDAPNYRVHPDSVKDPPVDVGLLEVCGGCAFNEDKVCALYDFTFDHAHVCDSWTDPAEFGTDLNVEDVVRLGRKREEKE